MRMNKLVKKEIKTKLGKSLNSKSYKWNQKINS